LPNSLDRSVILLALGDFVVGARLAIPSPIATNDLSTIFRADAVRNHGLTRLPINHRERDVDDTFIHMLVSLDVLTAIRHLVEDVDQLDLSIDPFSLRNSRFDRTRLDQLNAKIE